LTIIAKHGINYTIMTDGFSEKRSEKRDPCNVKIEFSIDSADCVNTDCGPWVNVTSDISFKGMGLYSKHPIRKDQKMKIFLNHVSSDPIRARARWCHKFSDELYRVGVLYE
jgi:hypothetical protein